MQTNYHYRARLNIHKRNNYLQWLSLLVFPMAAAGTFFGMYGFMAVIIFALIILMGILIKVDTDKNVLLFQDEHVIYLKNDTALPVQYQYVDIQAFSIHHPPKGNPYSLLAFKDGQKFCVDIDRPGGLDAHRDDLFSFLWEKNPGIAITVNEGLFRYKYFLLRGEVRRIEV